VDIEVALHRTLFEQAPIGVCVYDRSLHITACNERFAEILGSTIERIRGLDLNRLRDPRPLNAIKEALEGKLSSWEGLYAATTAPTNVHVTARFAPLIEGAVVVGGIGFIEDATERKTMEAHLRKADRMAAVGTLAAGVAHEINNPLAYCKANLDLAATRTIPELVRRIHSLEEEVPLVKEAKLGVELEKLAEMLELAREGAERVRGIVADLRTFSRSDDELQAMVDVHHVLRACINIARSEIETHARLVCEWKDVPLVLASEARLGQVFLNLLVNAVQALPPGDRDNHEVRVTTRTDDRERVIVAVSDTGSGMDEATQARVFDPFFTTKPTGLGLGLWICQGIVSGLGGQMTVTSQPGKGSTFTVTLPAQPER
jgi:PAS domain S-box-containing protein